MPSKYSLPIIQPAVEILKNVCRLLHLVAAILIAINAFHQLSAHEGSKIICYTQLIIAGDVLVLVFFGAGIFISAPKTGVLFRLIETITFAGIFFTLAADGHPWFALFHLALATGYGFIAYREWRIAVSESVELKADGITVPHIWQHMEIKWLHVKKVAMNYNSIIIETVRDQKMELQLRSNLKIDELQQINDFCSVHSQLGN